jgi:fructose-1,6-bisphosphatase
MDNKFAELFENWHSYAQKMSGLYERLGVLFTDLGIPKGDVRIIAFISSAWRGELKFYDANGSSRSTPQYLQTKDTRLAEDHLRTVFQMHQEHAIFTFDSHSPHVKAYDEFGMLHHGHEDIRSYGIVIQYNQLQSSRILFELMNQVSFFCRNILDDKLFEVEE